LAEIAPLRDATLSDVAARSRWLHAGGIEKRPTGIGHDQKPLRRGGHFVRMVGNGIVDCICSRLFNPLIG